MAAEFSTAGGATTGIAFMVSAGVCYEIIAASCSSPQTTELNAGTRAPTLMKWVNIGLAQAAGFVIVAAIIDRRNAGAIIAGGATASGLLYWQYRHARTAGLKSKEPGTEVSYA